MKEKTLQLNLAPLERTLRRIKERSLPEDVQNELTTALEHLEKLKYSPSDQVEEDLSDADPFLTPALDRSTDLDELLAENDRLSQAIQDAEQAKAKFVSVVTHELRIPMTSIKGYTDLLRQGVVGPVNEMQLGFLDIIRNNVERMSTLVSDLSDISRMETGRLHLKIEMVSVSACVEEALLYYKQKLEEKQQRLEVRIPEGLPQIYSDQSRVIQVLSNLISNSWKYTPAEGEITIKATTFEDRVRVEVQDTGIGIDPEDQERIFEPFFRSEDPIVREQQGWGLGLSIAKNLIELLNGEIGFESEPKAGSLFWISLPARKGEINV
jgi:signal transduction histidine kinase